MNSIEHVFKMSERLQGNVDPLNPLFNRIGELVEDCYFENQYAQDNEGFVDVDVSALAERYWELAGEVFNYVMEQNS